MRRRLAASRHYTELIGSLLQATEPVSFYDALVLVRQLRGRDPADPVVTALIGLHDADHATDGAREVLGDYLRATANRQENQRQLGARPITLKDHGKVARVTVGQTAQLRLHEHKNVGFRWAVTNKRGAGEVVRSRESNEFPSTAIFDVVCNRTGTIELEMREEPPRRGAPDTKQKPTEFALSVVVVKKAEP